jgi:hypothetical protein
VEESLAGEREAHWARRALERLRIDVADPRARGRAWRLLVARGFPEDAILEVVAAAD